MPGQQGIREEVYCHRYIYDSEAFHQTVNAALQTVLNVAGRGEISILALRSTANEGHFLNVTIDGNVVINNREMGWASGHSRFCGHFGFNASVLVEHRNTGGVNTVTLLISYRVN